MAVRDQLPNPSRSDHTRAVTGDDGNILEQDGSQLVTRPSPQSAVANNRYDGVDVGTGGGGITLEPDSLGAATTIWIALDSLDDLEFEVLIDIVRDDGLALETYTPARFHDVTRVRAPFPVLSENMRIIVQDTVHSSNRVEGAITLRNGQTDVAPHYNWPNVNSGRATAQVADGAVSIAGSSVPVPDGKKVAVKALTGNGSTIDVGDPDTVGTGSSMELAADQGVSLNVSNVQDIGMIVQTDGDGVSWIVEEP